MSSAIPSFPLYVDHRVGSIELAKHIGIPLQVTTLQYGDFAFMGFGEDEQVWNFGIERKTLGDLVSSMESGRFSGHQLLGLTRQYNVVYLLVEGTFKIVDGDLFTYKGTQGSRGGKLVPLGGPNRVQRFKYSQIAGFINTLQVAVGIKYWFTETPKESGAWIRDCYFHWQKKWSEHRSHLDFHKSPLRTGTGLMELEPPSLAQRLFKELKGIGWDRADKLAQAFTTPEAMLFASVKDFQGIEGIGKGLAQSMWDELHASQ